MLKPHINPLSCLHKKRPRFSFALHFHIKTRALSTKMAPPKSWLPIPEDSDFSLANIPFGVIISKNSQNFKRPAIPIGDHVLDLKAFTEGNGFSALASFPSGQFSVFSQPTLSAFAALGQETHNLVREYIQDVFSETTSHPEVLKDNPALQKEALLPKHETKPQIPMQIGDYTDFYAGYNHAFNAGALFRGPENALQPNYLHIPVGYHGRASSIVVSGTPIIRPSGQILHDPAATPKAPIFSPCRRLDFEVELGCFLCESNSMGTSLPINSSAEKAIFGYVLLNDWSARDIQAWEYVPLGPFNGKNFGSTISPWIVLPSALEPFRASKLENTTELLPYLQESREDTVYDISLSVDLTTPEQDTTTISTVSSSNLIWSFPQMIAHHSAGGCPMNVGDFLGSGTISGKSDKELGSLLEMTEGGKREIMLAGMDVRKFLKDGDTITLRGKCGEGVGFGECTGKIFGAVQS
ncbi:hypothetical protein HYALB_00008579 [Hymenoscyphus albidus]|uniref:Fumarylacetoacetase n=1 Tax=Hymenoscyphus albidus TaxID=595503 RepID=A0A9N9LES0_9HELO|nr:hypothetical protein HYALB_00008579 [Hymenoscyphus albidus]